MDKCIMEIFITTKERTVLKSTIGTVVMIPFQGYTKSDIFCGQIEDGAIDRQIIDVNNVKHMSARYMLVGKDNKNHDCRIYIENNGDFDIDAPKPFKTIPTFFTDSEVLGPYLHRNAFRGEGHREKDILCIKIFEIEN